MLSEVPLKKALEATPDAISEFCRWRVVLAYDMKATSAELAAAPCCSLDVDKRVITTANIALILFSLAAPLLSEQLISAPAVLLSRVLPVLGQMLARLLRAVARGCEQMRLWREQAFVLAHGAITYACGDVIAQTALALYEKYLELQSEGTVQNAIDDLYDIGRETNWNVPL